VLFVLRIDLEQEGMQLIPEPPGLGAGGLPPTRDQIKDRGDLVRLDAGQPGGFLVDQPGHGLGVEEIVLARPAGTVATGCGPPRIDFVHGFAGADEVLGQPPAIAPSAFDSPMAGTMLG
jgi:hypothetical protein